MLESIFEAIFGGIVEVVLVYIIKYPSAFIVWCFYRFKKPFPLILEDGSYLWGVLILFLIAATVFFYTITP